MDLKKLNVVELNAQEVKKTEGGLILWGDKVAALAYWFLDNWDDIAAGNRDYKNRPRK